MLASTPKVFLPRSRAQNNLKFFSLQIFPAISFELSFIFRSFSVQRGLQSTFAKVNFELQVGLHAPGWKIGETISTNKQRLR